MSTPYPFFYYHYFSQWFLTVPHTASSSIGPFNFIGDKQVTISLKGQPRITLVVFLFCVFRTNSWKDARLCRWDLCIRWTKLGEIVLTIFSTTMFRYKLWRNSSGWHSLPVVCMQTLFMVWLQKAVLHCPFTSRYTHGLSLLGSSSAQLANFRCQLSMYLK